MEQKEELKFDERKHIYTIGDKTLISVTQLVDRYKKPFDTEYWANKKAIERGVTPDVIKAEWKQKGTESSQLGTNIHAFMQHTSLKKAGKPFKEIKPINIQEERRMSIGEKFFAAHPHLKILHVELQVYDWEHLIAGTIDCVAMCDEEYLYIIDWKTNKQIDLVNRYGEKMLPPFDYLDNCHLVLYSLQISLYHYILEKNYNMKIKGLYLVHIKANSYEQIECNYLKEEVGTILRCRKAEISTKN